MGLLHLFLLLLPIFLSTLLQLNNASVYSQCLEDQKLLLLDLKRSLVLDVNLSTKLSTWNSSIDCCGWHGVTCNTGGRVIGLDLSNEFIVGGIDNSSSLFDLQYLESLNLSFNSFNGSIPSEIGRLVNLGYLNMSNSGLVGQIPVEISRLTRLVTLDLSTILLGVSSLKLENPNLVSLVQNLTQLIDLRLDGVNISTDGNEWSQAISTSLPHLQVLSMSHCFVSGPLHPSLARLQNLSVLHLSYNNLSASIPEFFASFSKLAVLRLASSNLIGEFPENLFQVPTLEILDLSSNKKLQGSLPEFHQNLSLQTLLLSDTNFTGAIPISIGNLGKLSRIELMNCNFSGTIPDSVTNLPQLVHMDLSYNRFTGQIPPLHMSKNLTYIDFSHNQLTGTISFIHWETLLNLVSVSLKNNLLSGNIPSSLLGIPALQKVWLSSNQFVGKVPDFTNASSSSLDTLDLSNNTLEGSIPSSIFDLHRLNILLLSSNKFNDSIELDNIWRLGNLTHLDLSYCNLSINASGNYSTFSRFPLFSTLNLASCNLKVFPDLRKQSDLMHLDLSDNYIDGIVPNWIWEVGSGVLQSLNLASNLLVGLQEPFSFPDLGVLDLHDNQLQGNIPPIPQLAVYADYSGNKFNSTIPTNIGDFMSFTFFFSLSRNRLTGGIPESLCNPTYLKVLDLSHNNLGGNIPDCLIDRADTLGVLNLRRNRFVGDVPDKFPGACSLQTLDLSGNQLKRKVPKSLLNCSLLEVLDIGHNQINDAFPCFLKNISSLRVLVLRSNKFYGDINCSRKHGTWPRLQIVDIASNNFSGPLPVEVFSYMEAMTGFDKQTAVLRFNPLQFTSMYYQDSITVTNKGVETEFVKMLTVFTSIDFSANIFEGPIPETIGQSRALLGLNLSHNALTGPIPSSLSNISQLESLDLSMNNLSGTIPEQLAGLTFLGFLNLSYNRLVGKIPTGTQLLTFSAASFEGNIGLCGLPLSDCSIHESPDPPPFNSHSNSGLKVQWHYIAPELGFIFGFGIIVMPLILFRGWRIRYYQHVDPLLFRTFPQLEQRIWNLQKRSRRHTRRQK